MSNLKDGIMQKIEKNKVKIRPKSLFLLLRAGFDIFLIGLLLLLIFIFNLVFYLPKNGHGLGLGANRLSVILNSVPWVYVAIGIGGLALAIWLIFNKTTAYKKRIPLLVAIFAVAIILLGLYVSTTKFNDAFIQKPGFKALYGQQQPKGKNQNDTPGPENKQQRQQNRNGQQQNSGQKLQMKTDQQTTAVMGAQTQAQSQSQSHQAVQTTLQNQISNKTSEIISSFGRNTYRGPQRKE